MTSNSAVPKTQHSNLTTLAATVRASLTAIGSATADLLAHAFEIGDALNAAKKLAGHGHWRRWLEAECGLSERTAQAYMRLANHRQSLESNPQRAADLSLRGALRLIGKGATMRKRRPLPALRSALWHAASIDDRMAFVDNIPLVEWLEVIPASWRIEIIDRVDGLRAVRAKPIDAVATH